MSWEDDEKYLVKPQAAEAPVAAQNTSPPQDWMSQYIVQAQEHQQQQDAQPWYGGLLDLARRIGFESTGAAAGWQLGQQYQKNIPQLPGPAAPLSNVAKFLTPPVAAGIGGLISKRSDQSLGNVLPGDEEISSDVLSLLGGTVGTSAPGAAAKVMRAPSTPNVRRNIRRMKNLGMDYTPGTVSDSTLVQGVEQLAKQVPITSGNINTKLEKVWRQFDSAVKHLSNDDTLDLTSDAWEVGKRIQSSAADKVAKYGTRSEALYRLADGLIPQSTIVRLDETKDFLAKYAGEYGDEYDDLRKAFGDKLMDTINSALTKHDDVPWHILNQIRTQVGRKTTGMETDAGNPELARKLYQRIIADQSDAVDELAKGMDRDLPRQAWRNANRYWRLAYGDEGSIAKTFDDILKADPDKLFRALESGNITTIEKTRKATDPETWKLVRGAVVDRMGQATPGQQDYAGQVFSPRTFLTNFNRLRKSSNAPMNMLFGSRGKVDTIQPQLQQLAQISDRLSASGRFSNPSGTAQALAMTGAITGAVVDPVSTAMTVGGSFAGSKLWVNKRFLDWLLMGRNVKPGTRAGANWVAALPAFSGAQYLSGSDENFLSDLRDGLNAWVNRDVPSVPQPSDRIRNEDPKNLGHFGE